MNKRTVITLSVLAIVGLGIAMGFGLKAQKPLDEHVVRIGYAPNIGYLPLHVANQDGLFLQEGVKVELKEMQTAQQLYEALVRGDLDYVPFLSLVPVMSGELVSGGNVKLVSVSDINREDQFDGILVKKDSKLTKISDLSGKKIGVFPGTTATNFLKSYLNMKGIDHSKTEFVQLTPPTQVPALEAGSIDALFAYEPTLTLGKEKFGYRDIAGESAFAAHMNHAAVAGYWFSTSFVDAHPVLAEKIVKAMDAGNTVLTTNPTRAREIAQATYKLDATVAAKVSLIKMVPTKEFKPEMFTSFVDLLVSLGELKSKPDLTKMLYTK